MYMLRNIWFRISIIGLWLIQLYAMSGHGKTGSSMPEGEEVERKTHDKSGPFVKPHAQA